MPNNNPEGHNQYTRKSGSGERGASDTAKRDLASMHGSGRHDMLGRGNQRHDERMDEDHAEAPKSGHQSGGEQGSSH